MGTTVGQPQTSPHKSAEPAYAEDKNTGPAKHTIGPHKSDILNVIDPRVRPDPSMTSAKATKTKTEDEQKPEIGGTGSALAGVPGQHGPAEHATASRGSWEYAGVTGVPEKQAPIALGGTSGPQEHRSISDANTHPGVLAQSQGMRPNMPGKFPSTASGI
jgi:hypothetical protein